MDDDCDGLADSADAECPGDDDDVGDDDTAGDDDASADDDSAEEGGCECRSSTAQSPPMAQMILLLLLGTMALRRQRA